MPAKSPLMRPQDWPEMRIERHVDQMLGIANACTVWWDGQRLEAGEGVYTNVGGSVWFVGVSVEMPHLCEVHTVPI